MALELVRCLSKVIHSSPVMPRDDLAVSCSKQGSWTHGILGPLAKAHSQSGDSSHTEPLPICITSGAHSDSYDIVVHAIPQKSIELIGVSLISIDLSPLATREHFLVEGADYPSNDIRSCAPPCMFQVH